MARSGEATFGCYHDNHGHPHFGGCYRVEDEAWSVYSFTHRLRGRETGGEPELEAGVRWRNGIAGVQGSIPRHMPINNKTVQGYLFMALGLNIVCHEVLGPNALILK